MKSLTVHGNMQSIDRLVEYVVMAAAEAGLNHRATYCLRLAVDEIATNIVAHGYQAAGLSGDLTVTAVFHPQQLIIELKDKGTAYDPRQKLPPKNLKQPPDKRKMGNLGVFLAMWGVDEFQYEQEKECNRSIFIMHRSSPKACS